MAVRDTQAMISGMSPVFVDGAFVFCTMTATDLVARSLPDALCMFRESEGVSLVLPLDAADAFGFDCAAPMRWIRLDVLSALDGVGLTAAVSRALADRGIPCNVVAAFHHDHVFVPAARADEALEVLKAASRTAP